MVGASMRTRATAPAPTPLAGPLTVVLRDKSECAGDRQLEGFDAGGGPAGEEVRMIVENLLSGEALPQTVAMLKEEPSGELVGFASVRMDGNAQVRAKPTTPWFLRRIANNPYVNVVARDERYRNRVLCDGQTRLGVVLVRAALEVVQLELADSQAPQMPSVWALIRRQNQASKRAFRRLAFYPHARSRENQQDVYVRRAGRALPPAPDPGAYRPAATRSRPRRQHLSA